MLTSGRGGQKGSALILAMVLVMVASALLAASAGMNCTRARAAFDADMRLLRTYAADAGLERVKLEVQNDPNWLVGNEPRTAVQGAIFSDGATNFAFGSYRVSVDVSKPYAADPTWYLVTSTAVDASGSKPHSTSVGMVCKNAETITTTSVSTTTTISYTYFSDYARFVSDLTLNVGTNAKYLGKVHTNQNLGVNGNNVTFYDDVTAHGNITYKDSTAKSTCTYKQSATAGVPYQALPEASMLEDIASSAPAGAMKYDWNNAAFKAQFQAATGKLPASDLAVKITLKKDKMDVVSTSKCGTGSTYTLTETNKPIPHDGAVFCRGKTTVSGNISRRLTVSTPANLYVDGPVRYVDDSNQAQWELRKKTDGSLAGFSSTNNSWTPTSEWDKYYNYVESSTWDARAPTVGGEKINPSLGLVAGSRMYVTGAAANREIMAALFASGDGGAAKDSADSSGSPSGTIIPLVSGKTNLYVHGAIITTGTNPLSGNFTYRVYAYDPLLRGNPPPGFPGGDTIVTTTPHTVVTTSTNPAVFSNWHIMDEDKR